MRRLLGYLAALLAFCAPSTAAAQEGPVPSFEGRCDVYGAVTFERFVTTEIEQHTYEFRTADDLTTCAGKLRYGDKLIGDRVWPVRVIVGGTGAVSCQRSTVTGGMGELRFLTDDFGQFTTRDAAGVHPLILETRVEIEHVLNSVAGTVFGGRGSSAAARATFLPTPEAIQACGEQGIRSLPFNGTILANAGLLSMGSRTLDTAPPRVSRVRLRRHLVRFRVSEPATITLGIRRGGRRVVRRRIDAEAGLNRIRIRRTLRRGRYRVITRAMDGAGNRSRTARRARVRVRRR